MNTKEIFDAGFRAGVEFASFSSKEVKAKPVIRTYQMGQSAEERRRKARIYNRRYQQRKREAKRLAMQTPQPVDQI